MRPETDPVVVDNLTKHYGPTRALDASSWTLPKGRLFGFLGPNGSGKTATIRRGVRCGVRSELRHTR
ncbi:MAG: hypothetical protein IID39_06115 [Planctomycetes bacterium]|nr:hypothetical protein [Planctomycetota bacterium]